MPRVVMKVHQSVYVAVAGELSSNNASPSTGFFADLITTDIRVSPTFFRFLSTTAHPLHLHSSSPQ
jgi:hypothetical protein